VLRAHRKYARPSTTTISPSRSANAPFSIWYRAHFRIDLGDADAVSRSDRSRSLPNFARRRRRVIVSWPKIGLCNGVRLGCFHAKGDCVSRSRGGMAEAGVFEGARLALQFVCATGSDYLIECRLIRGCCRQFGCA
jgi:hypothetical protein